jgi:hypothetical protein
LRPNIWPGLALAGGVFIAAVIALILLGGGAPSGGSLPSASSPGDTLLFPSKGHVAARTRTHKPHDRAPAPPRGVVPGGSAAESEYLLNGNRGLVLGGP